VVRQALLEMLMSALVIKTTAMPKLRLMGVGTRKKAPPVRLSKRGLAGGRAVQAVVARV
jgi:hypothetical protein